MIELINWVEVGGAIKSLIAKATDLALNALGGNIDDHALKTAQKLEAGNLGESSVEQLKKVVEDKDKYIPWRDELFNFTEILEEALKKPANTEWTGASEELFNKDNFVIMVDGFFNGNNVEHPFEYNDRRETLKEHLVTAALELATAGTTPTASTEHLEKEHMRKMKLIFEKYFMSLRDVSLIKNIHNMTRYILDAPRRAEDQEQLDWDEGVEGVGWGGDEYDNYYRKTLKKLTGYYEVFPGVRGPYKVDLSKYLSWEIMATYMNIDEPEYIWDKNASVLRFYGNSDGNRSSAPADLDLKIPDINKLVHRKGVITKVISH